MPKQTVPDVQERELICEYCGEELVGPGHPHTFIAPGRIEAPVGINGAICVPGECLNAAGYVTKHNPIGYPFPAADAS